jgi:hypothetical protein
MRGAHLLGALLLAGLSSLSASRAADDPVAVEGRIPLEARANDPDGGKLTFLWVQEDGPKVEIENPRAAEFDAATGRWVSKTWFVAREAGTYTFKVTVTNEFGQANEKRFVREVRVAAPPPVAKPGPDQTHKAGEKVVITGIDSKTGTGAPPTDFKWTIKQAPDGFSLPPELLSQRQFDFIARKPGTYVFELTVSDGKNWSPPQETQVSITPPKPPNFDPDPPQPGVAVINPPVIVTPSVTLRPRVKPGGTARVGDTLVLDGSDSTNLDKKLNPKFFWSQKDNGHNPLARPLSPDRKHPFDEERNDPDNYWIWTFVAKEPGNYTFVLRITVGDTVKESEPVTYRVLGDDAPPQSGVKLPVALVQA